MLSVEIILFISRIQLFSRRQSSVKKLQSLWWRYEQLVQYSRCIRCIQTAWGCVISRSFGPSIDIVIVETTKNVTADVAKSADAQIIMNVLTHPRVRMNGIEFVVILTSDAFTRMSHRWSSRITLGVFIQTNELLIACNINVTMIVRDNKVEQKFIIF